jgi:hypothetical protein
MIIISDHLKIITNLVSFETSISHNCTKMMVSATRGKDQYSGGS